MVKVNNLCPADGNPLCSQGSLSDENTLGEQLPGTGKAVFFLLMRMPGANVNFDLCMDDGAAAALFNSSGVGAAKGTAELVSCDLWSGSANIS